MSVGILDYGSGNLLSVKNALEFLGASPVVCDSPESVATSSQIIIPGVGSFHDCIRAIRNRKLDSALNDARQRNIPILGICMGMQVMATQGHEGGDVKGLGWFDADVIRLNPSDRTLSVPQVGWSEIKIKQNHPVLQGIAPQTDFYFVHSYYMQCTNPSDISAICLYGSEIPCAVAMNSVFAVQFHPEKSQDNGLKLLENFLKWDGNYHG